MTCTCTAQNDLAYPVPFRIHRDARPGRYRLTNDAAERLDGVALSLLGAGVMPATPPATLDPGDTLDVTISARDLARTSVLIVRWFRPDGREYLWRVSF